MIIFSIAHLCDEFGVTPRALRYYEERGLLSPTRVGTSGERVYSHRDRVRLLLTIRGKNFGFSLVEIKEMLDLYDLPDGHMEQLSHVLPRLRSQLDELQAEHSQLELSIEELASTCAVVKAMLNDDANSDRSPSNNNCQEGNSDS